MKIIITGASGYIGRILVPYLSARSHHLLLVGQSTEKLDMLYPHAELTDYEGLKLLAPGHDAIIHLAIPNNDSKADIEAFCNASVALLRQIIVAKNALKIPLLINIGTTHALGNGANDAYSRTNAEGEALLNMLPDGEVVQLRVPVVVNHDAYQGKLERLNRLPSALRRFAFFCVAALRPTVDIATLATVIDAVLVGDHDRQREILVSDSQMHNPVYSGVRRLIDLSFVAAVVIIFWWLLIVMWIAIRVTSPGNALFKQQRVGRNGDVFTCYKFRTMYVGTKQAGSHEVGKSAVTPIGNFMRRTKIDELPQIVNIVRNEMSLVGPRPCLPSQTDVIEARDRLGVNAVIPGITGLSQVDDIDMSMPEKLAASDARYIALRSIVFDLKILLRTASGKGQGDRLG